MRENCGNVVTFLLGIVVCEYFLTPVDLLALFRCRQGGNVATLRSKIQTFQSTSVNVSLPFFPVFLRHDFSRSLSLSFFFFASLSL